MFTIGAFVLICLIAWFAARANEQERPKYDQALRDENISLLVLHVRQDLKLVAFVLGGILLMLGVIADRIR